MSTTLHIDTSKLRGQLDQLRAAVAEMQKRMDEIGMLLVLAEKYRDGTSQGSRFRLLGPEPCRQLEIL